jgi:hypothetical protein
MAKYRTSFAPATTRHLAANLRFWNWDGVLVRDLLAKGKP